MKNVSHAPEKPEEILYVKREDGLADVWMRRNVIQQACPFEGDGENLEYVYDEVFFQTSATQEEIEADLDTYWSIGEKWTLEVPLTKEEQQEKEIAALKKDLAQAEANLEQAKMDNTMAIAELTMVMAAMMAPATEQKGEENNV